MELILHKGYWVRPGTLDDYVVNEISSYRHMPIVPGDRVLDIGGNIGSFAKHVVKLGAKVTSVEPDPENFELLQKNSPYSHNIQAAVSGEPVDEVLLYKNVGKNKGLHSTVKTRGREVIIVNSLPFSYLLDEYRPNKLKIDCEGAEYNFLFRVPLPTMVEWVILEYNLSRRGEQELARWTHGEFLKNFDCVKEPRFGTKAWATLACYKRK